MLALATEFPHVGSTAWLKPDADRPEVEPVRIILQRCEDGTRLISRTSCYPREACTANLRVTLDRLAPTAEEAVPVGPVAKPYRSRRAR